MLYGINHVEQRQSVQVGLKPFYFDHVEGRASNSLAPLSSIMALAIKGSICKRGKIKKLQKKNYTAEQQPAWINNWTFENGSDQLFKARRSCMESPTTSERC
jgi:hypothetical protein